MNNSDTELEEILQKLKNRIYAIALIHTQLHHQTSISTLNFKSYLNDLAEYILTSLGENPKILQTHLAFHDLSLHIDQVKTLGLIINECLTNSIKYAFPNNRDKRIDISLNFKENEYTLVIQDNGIGMPRGFNNIKKTGLYLIEQLCEEIDGVYTIDSDNGTRVVIIFPGVMLENTSS
jgi:two-component sensor histidine kinase